MDPAAEHRVTRRVTLLMMTKVDVARSRCGCSGIAMPEYEEIFIFKCDQHANWAPHEMWSRKELAFGQCAFISQHSKEVLMGDFQYAKANLFNTVELQAW